MNKLKFPLRYMNMSNGEEKLFEHKEKIIQLDLKETAFVLVDVWDFSRVSQKIRSSCGYTSFFKRVEKVVSENIVPALKAARKVGMTIIHLPTEYAAIKYPQNKRLKKELNLPPKQISNSWPPEDFTRKLSSELEENRYWKGIEEEDDKRRELTYIHTKVQPLENEYVIANSAEMNEVLKRQKILNLVYVGFATNMCVIDKPGAMREMGLKRYRTVLLRDCTTAFENQNTFDKKLMTKLWAEWIEMCTIGYTANSKDFIETLNKYYSAQ